MDITFLGAAETVTGSKYLLCCDNKKILIDCGLYQGRKALRLLNWRPLPIDPASIDAVILTHAHIDHTGYLPLFVKNGFTGPIYSTEGTRDLCSVLLPDSGYLQEEEAAFANRYGYSKHAPALPLYTRQDAETALQYFDTTGFRQPIALTDNLSFQFLPAGHIIGSAFIRIQHKNHSLLFTGDMGRLHDPVMQAPTIVESIDYLVVESTYGNRLHEPGHPKDALKEIINRTVQRDGTVVIPSFAVGRAQAILYYIALLKKEKAIPDIPVFLDSPMAINATHILLKHIEHLRLDAEECYALNAVARYVIDPEDSKILDRDKSPKIIISASGMITGGRILFHIETYAGDSNSTILFTGYQAEGTRGGRILAGEKAIKMHGKMVPVQAEIASLSNTSAHADYQEILQWLSFYKQAPQKVFITHGERDAAYALQEKIQKNLGWNCVVPHYLQKERLS